MRQPVLLLLMAVLAGAACPGLAIPAERAPVVYTAPGISIQAGIAEVGSGEIIHFGDELSLVLRVTWDPALFKVKLPGDDFFTSAWPESDMPRLVGSIAEHVPGDGKHSSGLHAEYRFQLLDCPGESWSCPGNHNYPLPEFRLPVVQERAEATADEGLPFTPWPGVLPLTSLIPLNEQGQLYAFEEYFPAGGFPGPAEPRNRAMASLGLAAGGALILAGGLLMWPFSFAGRRSHAALDSQPRWLQVLHDLDAYSASPEGVQLDKLRRALVWYCSDELKIDVFDWLDADESAVEASPEHSGLRALFLELLHAPNGTPVAELRRSVDSLVADRKSS